MRTEFRRFLILQLLAVALLTNGLWLAPREGDLQYTYEGVDLANRYGRIVIENESTHFEAVKIEVPRDGSRQLPRWNDLNGVACEWHQQPGLPPRGDGLSPQACTFAGYLADSGPITVPAIEGWTEGWRASYVEVRGGYYELVSRESGGNVTLDVRPISLPELLEALARPVGDAGRAGGPIRKTLRSGDPVTAWRSPADVGETGVVFRVDGSYRTVVLVSVRRVDRAFVSPAIRFLLQLAGATVVLYLVLQEW